MYRYRLRLSMQILSWQGLFALRSTQLACSLSSNATFEPPRLAALKVGPLVEMLASIYMALPTLLVCWQPIQQDESKLCSMRASRTEMHDVNRL